MKKRAKVSGVRAKTSRPKLAKPNRDQYRRPFGSDRRARRLLPVQRAGVSNMTRVLLLGLLLATGLLSCSPDVTLVVETEYSKKIVGDWQGRVGGVNETISFSADGTFVSQVRPGGFISNTLGQGVTGTIRGTWSIKGESITLNISGAEDERILNKATSSTIETFKPNVLVVKSNNGVTSTFVRLM
jgi:hypothetical protein